MKLREIEGKIFIIVFMLLFVSRNYENNINIDSVPFIIRYGNISAETGLYGEKISISERFLKIFIRKTQINIRNEVSG
jgi:hypothetical protein